MSLTNVKLRPDSTLVITKCLVFIFCVNVSGVGGRMTTTSPETSSEYTRSGNSDKSVTSEEWANTTTGGEGNTTTNQTLSTTTPPQTTVDPVTEEYSIQEGDSIAAYCMERLNCSHICVDVVDVSDMEYTSSPNNNNLLKRLHNIPSDWDRPGLDSQCSNASMVTTCGGAHFLCAVDNASCTVGNSSIVASPVAVVVQPKIVVMSLREVFVRRQMATYVHIKSEGPDRINHQITWACATNVSNTSGSRETEGNLKSTIVSPTTGCTHHIHESTILANPMFNASLLTTCLVTCCARSFNLRHTNWTHCQLINISNAAHKPLVPWHPAQTNMLVIVGLGVGMATAGFFCISLVVFFCCHDPVKRSIRNQKYRQYLRDRKRYSAARRALEQLRANYPLQSRRPTEVKKESSSAIGAIVSSSL